jgi:hypothetical protein
MNRADVDRWLRAYIDAWKSYDRGQISALFAEDVNYRYHPYDDPVVGREAVVNAWLGQDTDPGVSSRDQPGTYDATYHAVAVDGEVAVALGATTYLDSPGGLVEKVYDNCFVIRFNSDGRCEEFTEWYMKRPKP